MKAEIERKNDIFQFISETLKGKSLGNKGKDIYEGIMLENFPDLKKAWIFRLKTLVKSWVR